MLCIDTYLDREIGRIVKERNDEEQRNHKSSGKLSASMLGQPLQWQILKCLGVPQKEFDEYTLRKFLRGKQVEEWLIKEMEDIVDTQVFVEYRDTVGYIDAMVKTDKWNFKNGSIPFEIKSVSNMKYKRILKQQADRGHKLQAGMYAVASDSKKFGIGYVATDDYRIQCYIYDTDDVRNDIDKIITRFQDQLATGLVPVFAPEEKWQANPEYNNYPEWSNLSQEEINNKLKLWKELKKQ